jgi:hypothetical protein
VAAPEEIGGISVTIQANTAPLDAAIAKANAAIGNLGAGRVTIYAEADVGSAKKAAADLKKQVAALQRNESPIPVRFKFDSSRKAVRETRESLSKEITRQGGLEVSLTPMRGAKQMLVDALGPVVIPVAFVWNGEWANGAPPTANINVQGGGDQGGGAQGGGGVRPQQPQPKAPTGEGAKEADRKRATVQQGTVKQEAKRATPAAAPQARVEPAQAAAEPVVATPPKQAPRMCAQCGEQYYPQDNGWNQHQQSASHKQKRRARMQGEAATEAAPRVTNLPYNPARNEEIMASTRVDRGIYTQDPNIRRAREGVAEQRNLGLAIDLGRMLPGGAQNPLLQRYVTEGGDIEALRRGLIQSVAGREKEFEESFPGPGGQTFWNKERTAGFDPRSMRVSAGDYARASVTNPGQFTEGAATEGGITREQMAGIWEEATRMRAAAYQETDEFKKMKAARRKVFRTSAATGELEQVGTELAYEGPFGPQIDMLRGLREQLNDPTLTDQEREVMENLVVGMGFGIGGRQRSAMDKRAYEKALVKRPDEEPRIGKGSRRFRKLAGGQGRKGPRSPTNVEDLAVIEVRDIVLDVIEQQQKRQQDLASARSTEQAMATRAINEATGRKTSTSPRRMSATGAPGTIRTVAGPVGKGSNELKILDQEIAIRKERMKTLEEEIRHVQDDDETIENYRASIEQIRTEELNPLLEERARYVAGLGERKKKKATTDPLTSRAQRSRKLDFLAEEVRGVTYEESDVEDFFAKRAAERRAARGGPNIPQFAGAYNPDAPLGADVPGETLSQRMARVAADEARAMDRAISATPVEEPWQPAWMRRQSSKDLTRYASGGGPGGLGDEPLRPAPEPEAAAAEPIRTKGGTKAEAAAAASGVTKFCPTCGRNVRAAGHEGTAMHANALARKARAAPGTARVAGGIDIATAEPVEAGGPPRTGSKGRGSAVGGLRSAVDVAAVEDVTEGVRRDVDQFREVSVRARQFASQVVQENPVRALSVAVGQVLVNTIGGRADLVKQQKNIDREAGELDKAAGLYGKALERENLARERVREIQAGEDERFVGEADRLSKLLGTPEAPGALPQITERRRQAAETQQAEVEQLERRLQGQRVARGAATLAVGTVGIVAGTALFQGAMAAFNLAVEQIGIGLGRVTGRLSDFEQRTGELAASMADAARANYGNVEGTVAGQLAMAGFGMATADSIRPLLEMRAQVIAGTKAFEEQLDMVRAARNIEEGVQGGMDVRALTQTTGGFPILNIGGQRSLRELIGGELGATGSVLARSELPIATLPGGGTPIGRPTMTPRVAAPSEVADATRDLNQNIKWWNEQARKGGSDFQLAQGSAEEIKRQTAMLADAPWEGAADLADRLAQNNLVLKGAGSDRDFLQFLQGISVGNTLPEPQLLIEQQARQLKAQMQGRAAMGQLQRESILPSQQFLSQLARPLVPFEETIAARTPGASDAANYQSSKTAIDGAQASLRAYADEGKRAADEIIRQADALTGSNLSAQWTQATSAVAAYGKQIRALEIGMMWKQVNLQVAQYDEQLRVANRSLADAKEFLTGIDQSGNDNLGLLERQSLMYSRQSAQIGFQQQSLGIQSQLLGMQNQQLGIRSKEMSIQSAMLGRQSQELGFQSQAMQLAQNQRQINFQRAVAGFAAPGTTPEERAARIEEAKIQADFAQKQQDISMQQFDIAKQQFGIEGQQLNIQVATLDIDKQQFALQQQQVYLAQQAYGIAVSAYNVQQQIVDLNAARAVEDLGHQIDLITRARTVTIELALDQEALQNLQAAQEAEMAQAQSVLEEAQEIRQQIISSQVQIAGLLGQGISSYASAILRALGVSFTEIDRYMSGRLSGYANLTSGGYYNPVGGGTNPGAPQQIRAEGWLGEVSSPTHMMVGEAGSETIAILRNPRHMTMGPSSGGSGGNYIQINVTGNTVRSDDDLETLAALVARKVEETMGRRASQLGFRVTR